MGAFENARRETQQNQRPEALQTEREPSLKGTLFGIVARGANPAGRAVTQRDCDGMLGHEKATYRRRRDFGLEKRYDHDQHF